MRLKLWAALSWACLLGQSLAKPATPSPVLGSDKNGQEQSSSLSRFVTAANASAADIKTARAMIEDAIAKMTKLNKARLDKPARNNYKLKPGTWTSKRSVEKPPPLLKITDDLARAAALVAELDARNTSSSQSKPVEKRAGSFWLGNLDHKGSVPWGDDKSYKVNSS